MKLRNVHANAHPDGNRIDVSWEIMADNTLDGVRIVRLVGRYPEHSEDGEWVADVERNAALTYSQTDKAMQGETYYYYTLFPYSGNPASFHFEPRNRVSALATSPHGYGAHMMELLPSIYHRYDKSTYFLQRFLSIVGGQIDQFHSLANATEQCRNISQSPEALLPLLAQWIGWKSDNKRDLNSQRNEIINAPALYRRVGIVPTLEATIKRISHWESRSKEYVHNIFTSNQPPRLNLWSITRTSSGIWREQETLESIDFCYEGRACGHTDHNGIRWLFYHTLRQNRWEIWVKKTPGVALNNGLQRYFLGGVIAIALWGSLQRLGLSITQNAILTPLSTHTWEILDGAHKSVIEQTIHGLFLYNCTATLTEYGPSEPLISTTNINKWPSVAQQGESLWLVWTRCSVTDGKAHWSIGYQQRNNTLWTEPGPASTDGSDVNPFMIAGIFDATRPRRKATLTADDTDGLWLFWQEFDGMEWQLHYNRHNGNNWGEAIRFPLSGGAEPRVQDDMTVLVTPSLPTPRIIVCWAQQTLSALAEAERWQVIVREKSDQLLDANNWSNSHALPKVGNGDYHDREPAILLNNLNTLEIFYSSNRGDSGWSIWQTTLIDLASDSWSPQERLTDGVYQQRSPCVLPYEDDGEAIQLVYRSNRKRVYNSDVYRASETHDERYAGSTIVDSRHHQCLALHNTFEDPQRYTYDTGTNGVRGDRNRIARDTVGEFLATHTLDTDEVKHEIERLRSVVREFMPVTDRVVFIPSQHMETDVVYHYSQPATDNGHYITSSFSDEWVTNESESVLPEGDYFGSVLNSGLEDVIDES
ncbi:hypothetical protein [Teredinibacter purpureus]|uniref:hypothetical protein n=1 Tax=Teredinibacter purpureus TaxID=2731756 RepID=UPI0005F7B612|nr:hypothetical protein [Teredinibacter purpureus]